MVNTIEPSITEETSTAYLRNARLLLERYAVETGAEWLDDPTAVAEWLEHNKPFIAKSTFRNYKASLVHFMRQNGPQEAVVALLSIPQTGAQRKSKRTSGSKLKRVPGELLDKTLESLEGSRSSFAPLVVAWLRANLIIGARPSEWEHARIKDDELIVQNAKATHGRANGPSRILNLKELPPELREHVDHFLELLGEYMQNMAFQEIYTNCRKILHRVGQHGLTLYSTRHQVIADLKAAGFSRKRIAAIAGHASPETAGTHYGRKSAGQARPGLIDTPVVDGPEHQEATL